MKRDRRKVRKREEGRQDGEEKRNEEEEGEEREKREMRGRDCEERTTTRGRSSVQVNQSELDRLIRAQKLSLADHEHKSITARNRRGHINHKLKR